MKKPPLHKSPLRHLDLFSGIGGFTIAAHWAGFQTVGFAEIEPYCCKILAQWWPNVPNIGDIDKIENFERFKGKITVLTAGVPCQPSSLAGKRRGSGDNRWLWTAVLNCVEAVRPTWLLLENPPGILTLDEFGGILLRLEKAGYEIGIFQVPANAVGAKHLRYRVFIVAHAECSDCDGRWSGWAKEAGCGTRDAVKRSSSDAEALANAESGIRQREASRDNGHATQCGEALADASCQLFDGGRNPGQGRRTQPADGGQTLANAGGQRCPKRTQCDGESLRSGIEASQWNDIERCDQVVADADRAGLEEHQSRQSGQFAPIERSSGTNGSRQSEPGIRGSFDGLSDWPHPLTTERIPHRSHRLRALGNSVVPAQAYPFFAAIAQTENCVRTPAGVQIDYSDW